MEWDFNSVSEALEYIKKSPFTFPKDSGMSLLVYKLEKQLDLDGNEIGQMNIKYQQSTTKPYQNE